MEEKRIERVGESMKTFAEVDRQILPIIGKCLDEITQAAESIESKNVSNRLIRDGLAPLSVWNTSYSLIETQLDITDPITDSSTDPGSVSGCLFKLD